MQDHRSRHAAKWVQKSTIEEVLEKAVTQVVVDKTSIESLKTFCKTLQYPRCGILFGDVNKSDSIPTVDAVYECVQDNVTGQILFDSNLQLVERISHLMGFHRMGYFSSSSQILASDIVRLYHPKAKEKILLYLDAEGTPKALVPNSLCESLIRSGELTSLTTLTGRTHGGGLDGKSLWEECQIVIRTVNVVVHTGFFRLNRPNHTPTIEDFRDFLLAKRDKAKIPELHLQLADYHLILFIAVHLGESQAERCVLSIFQEEDELVKDQITLWLS